MLDGLPGWATSLFAGAALVVVLDLLRVMLPSLSFVYAVIGNSDAGDFTGFAVALFVAAALLARACGINAQWSVPITAVGAGLARLAVVATNGGQEQLLVSSIGVVLAIGLIGALAGSDIDPRDASRGLALGFVYHSTVNAILRSQDSLWYGGAIAWLLALVLVGALALGWRGTMPSYTRPTIRTATPWLIIGPVIALNGIVAATAGSLRAAWGEGAAATGALLVTSHALGYVLGRGITGTFLRDSMGVITLSVASLTAVIILGGTPTLAALATVLVAVLTTLSLVVAGESRDDVLASRGRRSGAVAGGTLLFLVIGLGYYVGYETDLGFPQAIVPASAAVLIGLVLFRQEPRAETSGPMTAEDVATIAFAPFVALFVLMASTLSVPAPRASSTLDDLRVMTYNVRMGFDVEGRFNTEQLAAVIRSQNADIVVLNEVDRGWLLTGGHDTLELLSNSLQMDHVFAPAADAIWGNAVLSRFPLTAPQITELPLDVGVMRRSALSVTVDLGGGEQVGVIATHLSAMDSETVDRQLQAELLVKLGREFELRGIPVIIAGDLNAVPGADELQALLSFVDAVAVASDGRMNLATYPSQAPSIQIDHILVSNGFTARDLVIPQTTASDHLGVAVTIGRATN